MVDNKDAQKEKRMRDAIQLYREVSYEYRLKSMLYWMVL